MLSQADRPSSTLGQGDAPRKSPVSRTTKGIRRTVCAQAPTWRRPTPTQVVRLMEGTRGVRTTCVRVGA